MPQWPYKRQIFPSVNRDQNTDNTHIIDPQSTST
jgi:hypothetical protein